MNIIFSRLSLINPQVINNVHKGKGQTPPSRQCLDFGNFEPGNPSLTYGLTGLGARDTCMIILNQQKEPIPQEMAQGGLLPFNQI